MYTSCENQQIRTIILKSDYWINVQINKIFLSVLSYVFYRYLQERATENVNNRKLLSSD